MEMELLSQVEAVAMDMNATYNRVVAEFLPDAEIVYDRYHMEAQFSKEVMGSVRLDTAREMKEKAELLKRGDHQLSEAYRKEYTRLKGARWLLLSGKDSAELDSIFEDLL